MPQRRLVPRGLELTATSADGAPARAGTPLDGSGTRSLGSVDVSVEISTSAISWSIANAGGRPLAVRSIAVVFEMVDAVEPVRMFRHGYQSWSPSGVATLGVDVDPSTVADFEFLQATHCADQRRVPEGALRSEWVTVLADAGAGGGAPVLLGFDGGHEHDGTLWLRRREGNVEVAAEAFLGDAVLAPGEHRRLHRIVIDDRGLDAASKLDEWAAAVGQQHGARVGAPYQVGWCSWYQYFHDVTERHLHANLALAADWPFEVFQLDDGYQRAIGDWLQTNDKFPSGIDSIADRIAAEGRTPGLWLAPFLVAPDSEVATTHPDWIARHGSGGPLRTWWNPPWGGGEDGFMYGLDTTNADVLAHLESLAAEIVEAGFPYLKLDFTFSPSVDGIWADGSRTPAQRVRAGFDAIRRGAGDDAFLLGCGVPLSHVVGVVDGCRIGQDVAPLWSLDPADAVVPGYLEVQPATRHAFSNTVARAFQHRRLWLNDPDCLMLRQADTGLSPEAVRTWAMTVGLSGGMAIVSDDLALLDGGARDLLDEVLALGRSSDADAVRGKPPRCDDLLDRPVPTRLAAAGRVLTVDPDSGASSLRSD